MGSPVVRCTVSTAGGGALRHLDKDIRCRPVRLSYAALWGLIFNETTNLTSVKKNRILMIIAGFPEI